MSETDKPTITMSWIDWRGKEQARTINRVIDIQDFRSCAVFPWLLMAANSHLSISDLEMFLSLIARDYPAVKRKASWLTRRRWMVQPPDTVNPFTRPNKDGMDARAKRIIGDNPKASLRKLADLLGKHGVARGKDWVRRARG